MIGQLEVVPREVVAAAVPLREAAMVLDAVSDSRRRLLDLLATVPSEQLREAAARCLRSYELATWDLSEEAGWLAQRLTEAGGYYAERERRVAAGIPVLPPRVDMPPLRDAAAVPAPAPAPAPAPVATR